MIKPNVFRYWRWKYRIDRFLKWLFKIKFPTPDPNAPLIPPEVIMHTIVPEHDELCITLRISAFKNTTYQELDRWAGDEIGKELIKRGHFTVKQVRVESVYGPEYHRKYTFRVIIPHPDEKRD